MNKACNIYVTGDTHGEIGRFYDAELSVLAENDILIVCGDFGFLFYPEDTADYRRQQAELDFLAKKPYTVCFVDGNHENFDLMQACPTEEWNGGRIHRIRKNVIHLMRGQVYHIGGKKIFTMGGAYSMDKYARKEGRSWWRDELPSKEEYNEAIRNLRAAGNEVDVILSHTAPREVIRCMGHVPDLHDAELTGFLEWILYEVKFRQWYFGHWHTDQTVMPHVRAVYYDVEKIHFV